jgi:hypothetical protein
VAGGAAGSLWSLKARQMAMAVKINVLIKIPLSTWLTEIDKN